MTRASAQDARSPHLGYVSSYRHQFLSWSFLSFCRRSSANIGGELCVKNLRALPFHDGDDPIKHQFAKHLPPPHQCLDPASTRKKENVRRSDSIDSCHKCNGDALAYLDRKSVV